jgi:hypothetical protein
MMSSGFGPHLCPSLHIFTFLFFFLILTSEQEGSAQKRRKRQTELTEVTPLKKVIDFDIWEHGFPHAFPRGPRISQFGRYHENQHD